jgi:tetratricopeptide (TPR) repeat protein
MPPASPNPEEPPEIAPARPRGGRRGLVLTLATAGCLALGWTATRLARPPDPASLPPAGAGPQLASASPAAPAPPAAAPDPARVERAQREADAAADLLATVRARLDRARQGGAALGLAEIPALKRRCAEALRHFDRAFELDPGDRETLALRDRVSRSLGAIEAAEIALAQAAAARQAEAARLAEQARELVDQVNGRIVAWEQLPNSPPLSRAEAAALAQKCRTALRLSDRAIGLDRSNKLAWMQRVRAYRLLEDYPRMSEAMAQALALFRNDPELVSLKDRLLPVAQP